MKDNFVEYAWEADYNDHEPHLDWSATSLMYTLVERWEVATPAGFLY